MSKEILNPEMLRKERLKEFKISFMKLNNNNSNNDTFYAYPTWNYILFHINNTLVLIILNFLYKIYLYLK